MVRYLAGLKNVSLNARQAGVATDWAERCLAEIGVIVGHEAELKANPLTTRIIDNILNMMAAMQVMQLVAELIEGNASSDPRANLERGQAELARFTGGATLYRWSDAKEMFTRHYGDRPWAPIVATDDSGVTSTYYMRNWKLHRDPSKGPALHRKNQHGELSEYWVDGVRHRPHGQGPALISENFEGDNTRHIQFFENGIVHRPSDEGPAFLRTRDGSTLFEVYIENDRAHRDPRQGPAILERVSGTQNYTAIEYRENGMLHRPSNEGPALQWIDERGRVIREVFEEHGIRHRDPKDGPAWWALEKGCEEFEYMVQHKLHRPEAEGPAKFTRDIATGIIVREEYRRDDTLHRLNGPASTARDTAGRVTLEGWLQDGLMHRDERDGPALVERDSETGIVVMEQYHRDGKLHRIGGPAQIERDRTSGIVVWEHYQVNGLSHRDKGPSFITRDAVTGDVLTECYYRNGELHRLDGPASLACNEAGRITTEYWHVNGKPHRDPKDGPAEYSLRATYHDRYETVTDANGETREELVDCRVEWTEASLTEFYLNGERHRELADGPAVIERDAAGSIIREEYWMNGTEVGKSDRPSGRAPTASKPARKRRKKRGR